MKLLDRLTKPLVQFTDSLAFVYKDPSPAEHTDLIGSAVLIRLKFDVLVGEMKCGEYQDAKLNAKASNTVVFSAWSGLASLDFDRLKAFLAP